MDFRTYFAEAGSILFDGAIGTQIYAKGIPKGHCYDELNISMPEVVTEVHREYLAAGAMVITTNTFGANRSILDEYYDLGRKAREINYYGARLARQAAREKAFVAGSLGPISRPLGRERRLQDADIEALFREQIEALLEGGADLLIFETFADLNELSLGVETARAVAGDVFIIAEASFPNNGLTLYGKSPYEAALALARTGADVIGSNCGTGPQSVYEAVRKMGSVTERELSAMPNAGLAQFVQGKFSYPYNPEYFARYGRKILAAGIKVLGGCCGTTPKHIQFLSQSLQDLVPGRRSRKQVDISGPKTVSREEHITSGLKTILSRGSVIALEVDPPRDADFEGFLKTIEPWAPLIDVLHVSDSPMAKPRMSPIAAGKLLKDALGKEIVIHYTCRDRNILGIQADLIGASALGLENVLALGGDPPSIGDYPFATGVYDITAEGLVEMMSALNHGLDLLGNPIGKQTRFFIGIGVGFDPKNAAEMERARRKLDKGAHFAVTQPVFDLDKHRERLLHLKQAGVPVIVSLLPLVSFQNAEYIHYEVPGIVIPETYLKRMEGKKGRAGEQEGVAIAREILHQVRQFADGILIIPPLNRYHLVEEILS